MSRAKVTKEMVFQVADELMKEGKIPSAWSVRDVIGFGSLETIQKYLVEWRETIRAGEEEVFDMPEDVIQNGQKYLKEIWNCMGRTSVEMIKAVTNKSNQKIAASEHELKECLKRLTIVTDELEHEREMRVADQRRNEELTRELFIKEGQEQEARKNFEYIIGDIQKKLTEEQLKNDQLLGDLGLARGFIEGQESKV